ncbi:MAG: class I SAM-dependent methyltransferase [Acidobacteria bacterium]|nr:class I SAM-dependent methyltransferase [Acidobacteriota bacterium]
MPRNSKELAYIYDLYVMPIWRDCFDRLFNEKCGLPKSGQVLDVYCGTGGHAIEMAKMLSNKGNIIAIDENIEAISLANAKIPIAKVENLEFRATTPSQLSFADKSFDLIIADFSLLSSDKLAIELNELVRMLKVGGKIAFYFTSNGSFDEFFSIFWEALYYCNLSETLQVALEELINERPVPNINEKLLQKVGLKNVNSYIKKEVFTYKTAKDFFISPLIEKFFLDKWFSIIPKEKLLAVRESLEEIIERDRNGYDFDISIKATLLTAERRA